MINFERISNDVKSGSQSPIPFTYRRSPPPMHGPGRGCALRLSWFLGDTAFRFDFTFFVEEVDGLHRTQSAHVHCPSSQGNPEFPLGENRHKHHAHRTFYRGSPIPMSLRRDSLSLSLFLSLSLSLVLLFSFLLLSLPSLSLSLLCSMSRRREETKLLYASADVYTRACRTTIHMHDSLHSSSLSSPSSCPLPLHLSMQFSPFF